MKEGVSFSESLEKYGKQEPFSENDCMLLKPCIKVPHFTQTYTF